MSDEYTYFKFSQINKYLLDSLVKSYLYFPHPSDLNDPFDCNVDVDKSLSISKLKCNNKEVCEALEKLQKDTFLQKVKEMTKNCGVFSASVGKTPLDGDNSTLMWSHYSNNHKGICLTYRFSETWYGQNSGNIVGTSEVEYGHNSLTDWFLDESELGYLKSATNPTRIDNVLKKLLTIKSKCWEYEAEARIIKRTPGPFEIDRSCLKQICFGLNTPESDIQSIQAICKQQHGYDTTFCKIEKSQDDFGLKVVELTD